MNETIIRERIAELADTISSLSQIGEKSNSMGTYAPNTPPSSTLSIEELLDQVRLQVKYLMFDMEATRRENHYLREMLEHRWNRGDSTDNS
ncbi:MAG: hypothetical protein SVV80_10545 [Planctomycetota bacterium]|nr:hypothetical protein [Planctomycetota bacterium]